MGIKYLRNEEVDRKKWDATLDQASNSLPYAYSWYLDIVAAGQWAALVENDYERIMPLAWNRKKWGYRQVFQPLFSQQGGIFGKETGEEEVKLFLRQIPPDFRYVQLNLNEKNDIANVPGFLFRQRHNILLDLSGDYDQLLSNYSKSLRKRIRKAGEMLELKDPISPLELTDFYSQNLQHKVGLRKSEYQMVTRLMQVAIEKGKGKIHSVFTRDGELAASGFFLISNQRVINLFGASNELGRTHHAMHFLLDRMIESHAASPGVFDFEGSQIPTLADFFLSFGGKKVEYWQVKRNLLPKWIRELNYFLLSLKE